jgi:tRNA A-37 threonylcarbamoyl transferase component Bud32
LAKPFRLCEHCLRAERDADGLCPSCRFDGHPRNPPHLLPEGTAVGGRYVLGRREGQGGFSICYRAWDGQADAIVALKELFPAEVAVRMPDGKVGIQQVHRPDFDTAIRSLRHEAEVLRKLNQVPSVVRVGDVIEDNDTAYLSLEYLRGQSYEAYLNSQYEKTGEHMDAHAAVNVAMMVLDALDAVHARGLLHLDVKPANIRVLDDGRIVLLDFGSARDEFRKGNGPYGDTFTPGYAATEQHHPDGTVAAATDVYALGATLYHSLSLKVPMRADERECGADVTALSVLNPRVPLELDLVIRKAMAVDARDRYVSAPELRKALGPFGSSGKRRLMSAPQPLRIVAGLLDLATAMLVLAVLTATRVVLLGEVIVTGILLWWLTQLLLLAVAATPGMLLTGLRFTDEGGRRAGLRAVLVRTPLLIVTFVTFQWRQDDACLLLHDRLSLSRVVVKGS